MPQHWPNASLFPQHPIVRSRSPDEIREFLNARGMELDIAGKDARQFDACLDGIGLPDTYLTYVKYGAPVLIETTEANCDYWVLLPTHGCFEAVTDKREVVCGADYGYVLSPGRNSLLRSDAGSSRLSVRVIGGALTRQLGALLGGPPTRPLELAMELKLDAGHGRSIGGFLYQAIADFDHDQSILRHPLTASLFAQFITTGLLLFHQHNYSEVLRRLERPVLPRDVKRAIDFIEAHLDSAISLADIVAASGVPGRTLFKHFKDYRCVSPMGYLCTARFLKVRDELRRLEPEASVADVAMRWGFEHMGRFAVEYRKRFGESPSTTLGKRRLRQ
jgi:AraC-like DNA-binding protein